MAFTKNNEEAVSPVIGVILMVAITVILAAVIAAFVFGMAGNISKTKVVAITAQKTAANVVTLTNQGGQDVGSLVSLTISGDTASTGLLLGNTVGSSKKVTTNNAAGTKTHIIVVGQFDDSSVNQVLLDTYI